MCHLAYVTVAMVLIRSMCHLTRDGRRKANSDSRRDVRKINPAILLSASVVVGIFLASGVALALPSETPDQTPMVDGPVQAITEVGTNVWIGGNFSQVKQRNGTLLANVANVAVFDSVTDQYLDIAPQLGGTDPKVFDMALYGDDVLIAGKFLRAFAVNRRSDEID